LMDRHSTATLPRVVSPSPLPKPVMDFNID
jgi:hypothetical protein